jgi:YjjG family noncanonical pyrimidine nucleotidase
MSTTYYKTLFFDLDHTLWDYETSSHETLKELFDEHNLHEHGIPVFDDFYRVFREVNAELWRLYDHGKIESVVIRKERFRMILERLDAFEELTSERLSEEYLYTCPRKGYLMPGAMETLEALSDRYSLTLITNGFEDIQRMKLEAGKITSFFEHVITSQKAGYKKPAREIFEFALGANGITSRHAIMIGDNLATDIAGARNASIDAVFYNPDNLSHEAEVKHEIRELHELCTLL